MGVEKEREWLDLGLVRKQARTMRELRAMEGGIKYY
jgi:hypothetical protein